MSETTYFGQKTQSVVDTRNFELPVKRPFNWKALLFLILLIFPACFAALPYALQVQGIKVTVDELPILAVITLRSALIYSLLAAIGLLLAARIGLGLPFIEGWLNKKPCEGSFRNTALLAISMGGLAALIILALAALVFTPLMRTEMQNLGITIPEEIKPLPWQGFLASFYGGIVEEIQMRLFLMTLLAWLGSFISRKADGRPSHPVMWTAIVLAALLFGLAHLPTTAAVGLPMSSVVVTRALALNGIGGLAFGWLYWKRGLESAMIAHFSADIVVHVITPLIVSVFAS